MVARNSLNRINFGQFKGAATNQERPLLARGRYISKTNVCLHSEKYEYFQECMQLL